MKLTPITKVMFANCVLMVIIFIYGLIKNYNVTLILLGLDVVQVCLAWYAIDKSNKK
jgi:general stress protein CsbA